MIFKGKRYISIFIEWVFILYNIFILNKSLEKKEGVLKEIIFVWCK